MTSSLQAAYNEVALTNSRLRTEIERCREEQRVVLKHVEELRTDNKRLQQRIDTLEGMLGEANIAVPDGNRG
jgi:chromosome segregation ATPase